ncbi:hypothetical protein MMC10_010199 [Thelotrema lepadinum]|nr:hypothetical protein [Thelotrema lepadinum]
MLGEVLLNSSSSSGDSGGILGSVEGGLSSLENDLKNDLNGAIHSIAQALDIHDFYSAHIMDFCEGYYEPGPLANATVTPSKNVTDCSNSTSGYNFDPQAILQSQLKSGVTLDDLHWPKELEDAIQAAETAVKAMFVLYCIGVAFAGLAFLGAIFAFFTDGRIGAFVDATLSFLAFLALGIASAIASALIVKATDAINQYSKDVGIAAYKGSSFLALTWTATALLFVGALGWMLDFCVGPSRRKRSYV